MLRERSPLWAIVLLRSMLCWPERPVCEWSERQILAKPHRHMRRKLDASKNPRLEALIWFNDRRIERRRWWLVALAASAPSERCHRLPAKHLEIHYRRQWLKRIPCRTQSRISIRQIKETRLTHHHRPRSIRRPLNQISASKARGSSRRPSLRA